MFCITINGIQVIWVKDLGQKHRVSELLIFAIGINGIRDIERDVAGYSDLPNETSVYYVFLFPGTKTYVVPWDNTVRV